VAEAAVVGKEDPVKGEEIVMFVRLREGANHSPALKKDIAAHMRKMIGPIAVPEEIHFAKELPKTRSGKVMRRVLKAVANDKSIGDLTTLEDKSSVEEITRDYKKFKGEQAKKK
jgi:acetyl-CoA synthetase